MAVFQIITVKDEFVFVADDYVDAPDPVRALALALAGDGFVSGWRYNVGRGDGGLQYVASQRVALFAAGTVRVESFKPEHPVADPPAG